MIYCGNPRNKVYASLLTTERKDKELMFVWVHIAASISAILFGAAVLMLPKGTQRHVLVGSIYFASMIALGLASFGISEISGSFSIFHAVTIQSLVFVTAGLICSRFLRSRLANWRVWHARFMIYSYITLVVTGTAQFFDRLPIENEAVRAIVFLTTPAIVGWWLFEYRARPQMRLASE